MQEVKGKAKSIKVIVRVFIEMIGGTVFLVTYPKTQIKLKTITSLKN